MCSMRGRVERRGRGFTLLEVLLVVLILGLLAALVIPNYGGTEQQQRIRLAEQPLGPNGPLIKSIELFKMNMGRYPAGLDELTQVPDDPTEAKKYGSEPLVKPGTLKDPWGNEFQYKCPGEINGDTFDVYSFGPDGKEGGGDDIGNWTTLSYR